jgi:hypothetical protein
VIDKVMTFAKPENRYCRDPVFPGISRVSSRISLGWKPDDELFFRDLIDFCIRNVDILSYHQILCHFPIHFGHLLGRVPAYSDAGDMVGAFMLDLMAGTARHVCVVRSEMTPSEGGIWQNAQKNYQVYRERIFAQYTLNENVAVPLRRPLTWERKEVPECSYADQSPPQSPEQPPMKHLRAAWEVVGFSESGEESSVPRAKLRAYNLLTAVRSIIIENPDFATLLQDDPQALELLVICGVYADPVSMVAPTAFRMLEYLIYGHQLMGIEPSDNGEVWEIVEKYADDLQFGEDPTSQMVAAVPILWRHKYDVTERGRYPVVKVPYENANGPSQEFWVYERRYRYTPMELYRRLLLDEPPGLSALNL